MGGVIVRKGVVVKNKPQIWLEISIDLLHIAAWLGGYYFLKTLLPAGRAVTCAGILTGVCVVTECLLRAAGRFLSGNYHIQWLMFCEAVFLFFYGEFSNRLSLQIYGIFLVGLCIAGYFWCSSLQGMADYLEQNEGLKNVPEESIFRGNTGVVCRLILLLAVMFMGIVLIRIDVSFSFVGDFFRMLTAALVGAVRWLLRMLDRGSGETELLPEETSMPAATRLPDIIKDDHEQGLGVILLLIVIGLVIIYVFVRMILSAQIRPEQQQGERPVFHKKGKGEDVVEKLEAEEKSFLFFRNHRERVRYLFKKQMKAHYMQHVPSTRTAGELYRGIQEQESDLPDPRKEVYEKARYSRRPVTRQDVRKMKKNE